MSNRTAVVAFAVITGCVSIFSVTSLSGSAANAADECLSAPKATTPAGAHWYYRIEKGTKRKCWYLADEVAKSGKAAAAATPSSDAAEQDVPPPTKITPATKQEAAKKPIQKSVANARAELTAGTDDDPSLAESTWPPMPGPSAAAATRSDNQIAAIQPAPEAANRQGWNVATRWPEPTAVASASDQPATAPQQPVQPAPALTAERLATAAATPSAAPQAAVTTGAATTQPPQSSPSAGSEGMSLRIMLSVLVCLLALVAILGPVLFKYFRPKPRHEERTYGQRRSIWDKVENDETTIIWQDNPSPVSAWHHARVLDEPHVMDEPRVLNDAADEIEKLLARASKRSAA